MKIIRRFYTSLLLTACLTTGAMGLPDGATIVNGTVQITTNGSTQTITQGSNKAIINWNGFNIDVGELVHFVQPGSISAILNRVVGQDPSQILGAMRANGQVFLINPNGVVFGQTANIDVGSLVVSTLNITDDDFLQGKLEFQQEADHELASVINHGTIKINDNGFLVLTGPMVANEGVILAKIGQVALAGGTKTTVSFDPTGLIQLELPTDSQTSDGIVSLSQGTTSDILASVVSSGAAPAGQIVVRDGKTFLEVASGTVVNTGDIIADGMAGHDAGRVILDSTSNTYLTAGATLSAAGQGDYSSGGEVFVLSDEQAITELGSHIDVSGGASGNAGFAEQSARTGVVGVSVNMGAENGDTGTFLVDPGRAVVGSSGQARPGSMFYFESAIEGQSSGTVSIVANNGIDFENLVGGALTLQTGVNFTIDLIVAGGDGTDAVTFAGQGDQIVLTDADFTLTSVTGTDVNNLNVTVNGSGSILVALTDGSGGLAGDLIDGSFTAATVSLTGDSLGSGEDSRVGFDAGSLTAEGNEMSLLRVGQTHSLASLFLTNTSNTVGQDTVVSDISDFIFADLVSPDDTVFPTGVLGSISGDLFSSTNVTYTTAGRKAVGESSSFDLDGNFTLISSGTSNDEVRGDFSNVSGSTSLTGDTVNVTGALGPLTAVATAGDVDIDTSTQAPLTVGGSATGDFNVVNNGAIVTNQITATNIDVQATGGGRFGGNPILQGAGTLQATNSVTLTAGGSVGALQDGVQTDAPVLSVTGPSGIYVDDVGGNVTSATLSVAPGSGNIDFSTTGDAVIDSVDGFFASFSAPNGSLDITATTMFLINTNSESLILDANTQTIRLVTTNGDATVTNDRGFSFFDGDVTGGNLSYTNSGGDIEIEGARASGNVTLDTQGSGEIRLFTETQTPPTIQGNVVTLLGTDVNVAVDAQRVDAQASSGDVAILSTGNNLIVDAQAQNGSVDVLSDSNLAHGTIEAVEVSLTSQNGNITKNSGRITATDVTLQGNNVTAETDAATIDASGPGNVSITNFSQAVDQADITAGGDVSFTTPGTANINTFDGANLALDVGQSITGNFTGGTVSLKGTELDVTVTANQVTGVARNGDATITSSSTNPLTVTDSSATGTFKLDHAGDVEFNRIEAQNVEINAGGDITDTGNTIIASGITLNGNNVFVNTQGQVIVINAQGDVTVSNTLVNVDSLTIDADGSVRFDTDGNLTIASVVGGPLVDLKAGGNIAAQPNAFVRATDVALTVGGNITPDLNNPLDVQATNSITVNAPGSNFQGQGGGAPADIAAALIGSLSADGVAVISGSGPVYYNGILLNPGLVPTAPPVVVPPVISNVIDQIGFQNGEVVDDGSVGSAANDGIVEQSPTQKLVAQLTEVAQGGGGEGMPTSMLITLEIDALGELQVQLSEPSPFDTAIESSEDMTADDVLDLETGELVDVKVAVYYDVTNDQLVMAVDLRADDIIDLDVSDYELIPLNLEYSFLSDPNLILEALRADDLIDLQVEDLGNIPIRIHVEGDDQSASE
jgi:filamentous hemagglutinin family protein